MSRRKPSSGTYAAWRLFPSSRVDRYTVPAMAAAGLVMLALAPGSYHQPFSEWDEAAAAAPLVPATLVVLSGFGLVNVMGALERRHGIRLRLARLCWSTTLAGGMTAATALAAWLVDGQWLVPMLRNALGLSGLAFFGAVVVGARQAWVPVFLWVGVTLIVGRDPHTAAPHGWAMLLAPGGSVVALVVAVSSLVAGVGAYTCWDSRPTRGLPGEG